MQAEGVDTSLTREFVARFAVPVPGSGMDEVRHERQKLVDETEPQIQKFVLKMQQPDLENEIRLTEENPEDLATKLNLSPGLLAYLQRKFSSGLDNVTVAVGAVTSGFGSMVQRLRNIDWTWYLHIIWIMRLLLSLICVIVQTARTSKSLLQFARGLVGNGGDMLLKAPLDIIFFALSQVMLKTVIVMGLSKVMPNFDGTMGLTSTQGILSDGSTIVGQVLMDTWYMLPTVAIWTWRLMVMGSWPMLGVEIYFLISDIIGAQEWSATALCTNAIRLNPVRALGKAYTWFFQVACKILETTLGTFMPAGLCEFALKMSQLMAQGTMSSLGSIREMVMVAFSKNESA
jgi:hypothetical protein